MDKKLKLEWLDPKTLAPNPRNYREHTEKQKQLLDGVLQEVGWAGVALFNKLTGHLVDGHARRDWAIEHGHELPVLVGEWDEKDEYKILATLDPIAAMAQQNDEIYRELLEGMDARTDALKEWADTVMSQLKGEIDDPNAEWNGMPEYDHKDKTAFQTVQLHFKDQDAIDFFSELIGQNITPNTRTIWYPEAEIERYADKRYSNEA